MRACSAARAVRWLPPLVAAAYLVNLALDLRSLVRTLYWNSDAAAPFVLAASLRGHGHVFITHYGSWVPLGWLFVTRNLPGHIRIWEGTGYAFALLGTAIVGVATARVAGRWAGITAASITVIVGPAALDALLTIHWHVVPFFLAAVLSGYLLLLERSSVVGAASAGSFAGLCVASDPLTFVAAVVPFTGAALVLARVTRTRAVAVRAAIVLASCVVVAIATEGTMRLLGFWVTRPAAGLSSIHDAGHNVARLGRFVLLVGGANYFLPGGRYPGQPFRFVVTLLVLSAVGAIFLAAGREILRRGDPARLTFVCYWAFVAVLVAVAVVASRQGAIVERPGVFYVLTFAPAAAVGVSLLAARSVRAQVVVAMAAVAVGGSNIATIRDGRAEPGPGAMGTYAQPMFHLLQRKGITKGYAGYWDAQSLTWKSGMRLLVAPVQLCGADGRGLCATRLSVIESWYDPEPGPSFVLVDPETDFVPRAPRVAKDAAATYHFGPLTLYLFDDDVARRLQQP